MSILWYTIQPCWAHESGVQRLCTRLPCAIKGRRPLEKDSSRKGTWRQRIDSFTDTRAIQLSVDVGYYASAARTTLNPRVFLYACFMSRPEVSLGISPSNHPQGLGGCTTPPGCSPLSRATTQLLEWKLPSLIGLGHGTSTCQWSVGAVAHPCMIV